MRKLRTVPEAPPPGARTARLTFAKPVVALSSILASSSSSELESSDSSSLASASFLFARRKAFSNSFCLANFCFIASAASYRSTTLE